MAKISYLPIKTPFLLKPNRGNSIARCSDYIEIELKNGGYFDGTEVIHVWLDDTGSNNPVYGYDGRGTNTPLPGTGGIFSPWTSYITFIP